MNIITHNNAYSLYPKATLEDRQSLMISTEGSNQDAARDKYIARGWSMIENPLPEELARRKSPFRPAKRYIGDSRCWTIPIEPRLDLPGGFIETNTWGLTYDSENVPTMSFKVLLTDCLRSSYLVVDDALAAYLWPAICPTEVPQKWVFIILINDIVLIVVVVGIWIKTYFNSSNGEEWFRPACRRGVI